MKIKGLKLASQCYFLGTRFRFKCGVAFLLYLQAANNSKFSHLETEYGWAFAQPFLIVGFAMLNLYKQIKCVLSRFLNSLGTKN